MSKLIILNTCGRESFLARLRSIHDRLYENNFIKIVIIDGINAFNADVQ